MAPKNKFADTRNLREVLSGMNRKEKMEYLLSYYWWVLVVAALVAFLLSGVGTMIRNARTELLVGGCTVDVMLSDAGSEYLQDGMWEALGGEKYTSVTLRTAYLENGTTDSSSVHMAIISMIGARTLDYMIADKAGMEFYMPRHAFTALDELLPPETLAHWEDKIITCIPGDGSDPFPAAVDISDLPFVKANIITNDSVYIAFTGNREIQRAEFILAYLESWQEP